MTMNSRSTGPILSSDLQAGEVYDARLETPGWNKPEFDASQWQAVSAVSYREDHLVATNGPLVRPHVEMHADRSLSDAQRRNSGRHGAKLCRGRGKLALPGCGGD